MCIRDRAYADGGIEENAYNLNYTFEANTVGYLIFMKKFSCFKA